MNFQMSKPDLEKAEGPEMKLTTFVGSCRKQRNSRKNEEMESKQKQYPVVDVTGERRKVLCCKKL